MDEVPENSTKESEEEKDSGVKINLISSRKLDSMTSYEKLRFILDEVKKGTVLVLERGLTATEEIDLIKSTMSEIDHQTFIGIEMQSYSSEDLAVRGGWFTKLLGRAKVPKMSVIGPANLLRTIHKNGSMIQAMILTGKSIISELKEEPVSGESDEAEPGETEGQEEPLEQTTSEEESEEYIDSGETEEPPTLEGDEETVETSTSSSMEPEEGIEQEQSYEPSDEQNSPEVAESMETEPGIEETTSTEPEPPETVETPETPETSETTEDTYGDQPLMAQPVNVDPSDLPEADVAETMAPSGDSSGSEALESSYDKSQDEDRDQEQTSFLYKRLKKEEE
jgi:hypothetical protein